MENFYFSTDNSKLNIELIHNYLIGSYWAKNRPREIIEKSIRNSLCFGVYHNENQIGFARVISDFALYAYLADVFIIDEYKGKGIGKKLVKTILAHPELQTIKRWMLATSDAHGLYSQFGFTSLSSPEKHMELLRNID